MTTTGSEMPNSKTVNINTVAIPLATIISLLSFVMWATYEFAKDRQALKDELQREFSIELKAQREIIEQIKSVIITVRERQTFQLENLWSKKDHMLWCYEAQKKNVGFECPDYKSWKEHGLLGTYEKFGLNGKLPKQEEETNNTVRSWNEEQSAMEGNDATKKQ